MPRYSARHAIAKNCNWSQIVALAKWRLAQFPECIDSSRTFRYAVCTLKSTNLSTLPALPMRRATLTLLLASLLAGCSGHGAKDQSKPPAQVGYIVAAQSTVPVAVTLSGRTVAYETSEVRPQVTGVIAKRLFTEGSYVKAGQPLYQIACLAIV